MYAVGHARSFSLVQLMCILCGSAFFRSRLFDLSKMFFSTLLPEKVGEVVECLGE